MYADRITDSMQNSIDETYRRRGIQHAHNQRHGIEPQSIHKAVRDITEGLRGVAEQKASYQVAREEMTRDDMYRVVKDLEFQMKEAARALEFEKAAHLRDEMLELKKIIVTEEKMMAVG